MSSPEKNSKEIRQQVLEGTLERITFQNDDNGYTVAKLTPKGKTYEVTIVGTLTGANPGETIRLEGFWTVHNQYGRQFEVHAYTVKYPSSVEGIRKYLGSGLIVGVGPVTARRIVDTFGKDTLDVIENHPARLKEVPGIGGKKTDQIMTAWEEQKQVKEIMLFLQSQGVNTGLAAKIYKQYQADSINIVKNDPYRLAKDIYGIGFKTADKIARQMGLALNSPARIQAGIIYALNSFSENGHCYANRVDLLAEATTLLQVDPESCEAGLDMLVRMRELIAEDQAIYLPPFFLAERNAALKLRRIQNAPIDRLGAFQKINWEQAFALLDQHSPIRLTDLQKKAVRMALTEKVSVLTGGPGTGKSTITANIIQLLKARGGTVLLAAPTGRAAKRLGEATGMTAKTIHRLLEYSPSAKSTFLRDQENPLNADLIIIDEASMVDILLINHLLSAIEVGSHVLFIGDMDQLPSVGPGNVLHDIIASDMIPITRLDTIFRQAPNSYIIVNAHQINQGSMPILSSESEDFFLFNVSDPVKAAEWVVDVVTERVPRKFGFNPLEDIMVLSPMHRGPAGVTELNIRLQEALNPPATGKAEFTHGSRTFRIRDRVMQIRNDYDRIVFNGDLGVIDEIDLEAHVITVNFDGRPVAYEYAQLDELVHAYAASIHKAQGSEFPVVVMPLLTQHFMLLQRNLLYTGVTRARKVVILVGSKRAISIAVQNDKRSNRNTRLADRLKNSPGKLPQDSMFTY